MFYVALAVCAGAMLPAQAAMNAKLGHAVGSPLWAASFSGLLLTIVTTAVAFAVAGKPQGAGAGNLPWWAWTGGLCGAFLLSSTVILAQRLGTATTFSLVVAGQIVCALLLDQFGFFGLEAHDLNVQRVIAALFVIGGAALMAA